MELKVVEKKYYGDDVVKLVLESEELKGVDVHGKIAILSVNGKDKRPYSIGMKISAHKILFFIKKVGVTSGQLYDVNIGDLIQCPLIYSSSFGRNLKSQNAKICCIGGGVGVSPLINLLKYNKNPESMLVSSFRTVSEAIISSEYTHDMEAVDRNVFITREMSEQYKNGRISKEDIDFKACNFEGYYICGTKEFCDIIVIYLAEHGIDPDKIFVESW